MIIYPELGIVIQISNIAKSVPQWRDVTNGDSPFAFMSGLFVWIFAVE